MIVERNLKILCGADVKIAMGTDSGATPLRIQGFAGHLEMGLMGDAGMRRMDVPTAATRGSAAVAGTAVENIRNTREISAVWDHGREVHRNP